MDLKRTLIGCVAIICATFLCYSKIIGSTEWMTFCSAVFGVIFAARTVELARNGKTTTPAP